MTVPHISKTQAYKSFSRPSSDWSLVYTCNSGPEFNERQNTTRHHHIKRSYISVPVVD